MASIEIDRVTKVYGNGFRAVDDVSLTVDDGEFMVLVGPSGCGKSTLLRMVAGLEEVTSGSVRIGGADVTELAPRHRDIAMVFQSYALYPHMTVRDNLGYGLKVRKAPKAEAQRRVEEVGALLGLTELLDRKPAQLSGGQRQRVAVMRDGVIVQVAEPQVLYAAPRNLFVAAFIGSPAMNLVEATIQGDEVAFGGIRIPLDAANRPAAGVAQVILGVRPEAFEDPGLAASALPRLRVRVEVLEELGADTNVFFRVEAPKVAIDVRSDDEKDTTLLPDASTLFTARVDPRTRVRGTGEAELAVDPSRFHFFDPVSGAALPTAVRAPLAPTPVSA